MAQYQPHYKARDEEFYDEISRPITEDEYDDVIDHARESGLERLCLDYSMRRNRDSGFVW